jgi:hypothetical protein
MSKKHIVLIDHDEWESIRYGEIKRNDQIRIVTVQGNVTTDVVGVVDRYDEKGLYNNMNVRFTPDPDLFKPKDNGHRTIYRRKPEPFVFPTQPLTVIEGTGKYSCGTRRRYIRLENGTWRSTENGGLAFEDALAGNFTDWKVIYEGIEL